MEHSKCDKPFQDLSFFRSDLSERAQHNWFNTFEFLHYDVSKNAVLLHVRSGCVAEEDKEGEKSIPLLLLIYSWIVKYKVACRIATHELPNCTWVYPRLCHSAFSYVASTRCVLTYIFLKCPQIRSQSMLFYKFFWGGMPPDPL